MFFSKTMFRPVVNCLYIVCERICFTQCAIEESLREKQHSSVCN